MAIELIPVPHARIGAPFVASILAVVFAGGVITGLSVPRPVERGSQEAAIPGTAVQAPPLALVGDRTMSDAAYAALHGPAAPRARVTGQTMSDAAYAALHGPAAPRARVTGQTMSDAAYAALHGPAVNSSH